MKLILFAALSALTLNARAQDAAPASPWSHESEASIIQVDGTSQSESYAAKQKTTYKDAPNVYSISGRYLQSKANGVESARAWDSFFRYERELSELWSVFAQYGAESDIYSGYVQRDSADLGGKYYVIKTDPEKLFAELGYRYMHTRTVDHESKYDSLGRLYVEWSKKASDTVSFKFWVEYLPNFTRNRAYLINGEPSVQVMLNSILSLKVAYLVKYQNEPPDAAKHTDRTLTTSLVAKF